MTAIPDISVPEIYTESAFLNSKFIEIKTDEMFDVKMQYPLMGMKHAENQCFVREEVYVLLQNAAKKLPKGYKFRILDAWRPFQLQYELYEIYSKEIIKSFGLDDCTQMQREQIIRKFVSEPVEDKNIPPVHTTGGAIDLTILDKNGNELEMGTGFDSFSEEAGTAYFEKKNNQLIRDNRRLLFHVMTDAGFTNLPSEWWHYDYGDRFWGFYKNKPAIYKGAFVREEIYGA